MLRPRSSFRPLGCTALAKMLHTPAAVRVHKAMQIRCTTTGNLVRKHYQALEAEARSAYTAHHLVALGPLGGLLLQILLCHHRLATGALLRACLLHPLQQPLERATLRLLLVLLASEARVEGLRSAAQTGSLPAKRTMEALLPCPSLHCHTHGAVRGWARPHVLGLQERLLQALCLQTTQQGRTQEAIQNMLWDCSQAFRTVYRCCSSPNPHLCIPLHTILAIPSMTARQPESLPCSSWSTADGACHWRCRSDQVRSCIILRLG
mmetsp:Transcript_62916/g.149935  ORF Transcript_62916/g.149935 Transcript_62916/m.149935 type:complete len:264 (-) Transcript_62916:596-1387(-)